MTNKINKTNRNYKKGFSVAEAMISAFILSVGLVAVAGLISSSIRYSIESRDRIIAAQLAQEGVEMVRNIRDNNWAVGDSSFDNNLPSADMNNCQADKGSSDIEDADCNSVPGGKVLNYSAGFYIHGAVGTQTKFQRKIEMDYDTGASATADNLTVSSMVVWGRDDDDFPVNCSVSEKCVLTRMVLTKWGE